MAKLDERRIAKAEHNHHVVVGVDDHSPTQLVPRDLLREPTTDEKKLVADAQSDLAATMRETLGEAYYEGPGYILYRADACEALRAVKGLRKRPFALSLTSPPYNIGKEYESIVSVDRYISWCTDWLELIHSVTTDSGCLWLNLGYLEVPGKGLCIPIPYLLWDKTPFYLLQEVVWHYGAGVACARRFSPRNEKWLFYVKDPASYTFNLDPVRDPNVKYPNQKKNGKFRCNPNGKNPSDVWLFPKVTTGENRSSRERTAHPAQFPLGIVERLVKVSSNPGDIVLDPFSGSGSTGIAASGLQRLYIGFETNESYCKLAATRHKHYLKERADLNRQGVLL